MLDWPQWPDLEADPDTAHIVLEFLSRGYSIDDGIKTYDVDPDQLKNVLRFIAANLEESRVSKGPEG